TFVYAGIDVERCGVFTGTRGRQLAGRCGLICTGAFPCRDEWAQLIAALEATLRLHCHQPGTLPAQAKYLHQRTGAMIGSLTHLIRGAAIRAILGGQEALTRPLLDTVRLDHAAESATRRSSSTRRPPASTRPGWPTPPTGSPRCRRGRCHAPSPPWPANTTTTTSPGSPRPTTWCSPNSPTLWTTPRRSPSTAPWAGNS